MFFPHPHGILLERGIIFLESGHEGVDFQFLLALFSKINKKESRYRVFASCRTPSISADAEIASCHWQIIDHQTGLFGAV